MAGQPPGVRLRGWMRSPLAEVEIFVLSRTTSEFVAQAMLLVKATIPVMPARHGQEGATQVCSNHWNEARQPACMPLALLVEQADARVALG